VISSDNTYLELITALKYNTSRYSAGFCEHKKGYSIITSLKHIKKASSCGLVVKVEDS